MSALVGADGAWPELVSMPGRRTKQAGRLVCVIDTSASIDAATLGRFLGAVAAAATAEGIDEVRRIQADAAITRDEVLSAAELPIGEVAVVGRGGSDFRPALRALSAEARREGEAFTAVYLTDLEGAVPEPEEVIGVSVLWVVPGKAPVTPAVGRVLSIPPTQRPGSTQR
jgi:predicted metal-dependent peptidase